MAMANMMKATVLMAPASQGRRGAEAKVVIPHW